VKLNFALLKNVNFKERLSFFTPAKYKNFLRKQMIYAGIREEIIDRFIGFSFFFSLFLGSVIAFDLYLIGWGLNGIALGILIAFLALGGIQITIVLIADSRAAEIEKVLPDVLQLMSANIRAGMTVDRALWLSARPEFGVFEEEIRKAGARTLGGKPIKVALLEMSSRIKSNILEKAVRLLIEGIEAGGELAHLLEETSNNVRITQSLKKEIKASVTTYSIFILFAAVIGAPALYAISLFFVETMTRLWSPKMLGGIQVTGSTMGGGMLSKAGPPTITVDQLFWFAVSSIVVTTFFGSLIIGLIQTGKEKNGLRFVIPFMLGGLAVFLLAQFVIKMMFGGFFAI